MGNIQLLRLTVYSDTTEGETVLLFSPRVLQRKGDAGIKQKRPVSGRSVNPARLMASDKMHASDSLSFSPNNRDAASTQHTERAPKNGKLGRRKEGSQRGTKRLSALITAVPIAAGHRGI